MTSKTKVYELAKQLGVDNQTMLEITKRLGIDVKNSMSVLGTEEVKTVKEYHLKNRLVPATSSRGAGTAPRGSVTEKRVGSRVIRRRVRPQAGDGAGAGVVEEEVQPQERASEAAPAAEAKSPAESVARVVRKSGQPKPVLKKKQREEPAGPTIIETPKPEVAPAPPAEAPAAEAKGEAPKEETPPARTASNLFGLLPKKKQRAIPSILKRTTVEKHLEDQVGPKVIEKRPKPAPTPDRKKPRPAAAAAGQTSLRRVKEINIPAPTVDPARDAGKRRLMQRQNTVFRSADYLKRELIHATRRKKGTVARQALKTKITTPAEHKRVVEMAETITVSELAREMGIKAPKVVKKLMELGVTATMNDSIDHDTASLVAQEFGYDVKQRVFREEDIVGQVDLSEDKLKSRAPVVTIMGHVDHGKTSLLDKIRASRVAEGEAGGITQHIGAYTVTVKGKGSITFVDTPGHEAFTAMRARGAKVTDIVILVVAATDGVMPQTLESVHHAKAAGVPLVVAVNKVDLPDSNPDRVRQELAGHDLAPEEWGGDTMFINVSAKTGEGLQNLLEAILLQAEVLELKANYECLARGTVIESRLDKHRGAIATVLVQHGVLHAGDILVSGNGFGKVRAMTDSYGKPVKEAGPSVPVEILGLPEAAPVGEEVFVVENEKAARTLVSEREARAKREASESRPRMTLEEMFAGEGGTKELRVILKTDVLGSTEAIKAALTKLPDDKVKVKILHAATGGVTESDINLAVASKAVILGFNVRPDAKARKLAEQEGVDVRSYGVIYELVDEVKGLMEGLLDKIVKETVIGHAEVRNVFNIPKIGAIAGTSVTDGKVTRGCYLRVLRDSRVVYEGKLSSLRRFKDDVKEVQQGYECGIGVENFNDIKLGDQLEAYIKEEEQATL